MLSVINLSFDYQQSPLLENIQLMVEKGRILHLKGDNGAGKTTLLRLLAGLLRPMSGDIAFDEQSIYKNLSNYQQSICYVGHKAGLSGLLTVRENCVFDLHWLNYKGNLDHLLARFNLLKIADIPCHHLSAGQRRRVALLRLAMTSAKLWLLDEPFVALDRQSVELLTSMMITYVDQGGIIILTSHQDLSNSLAPLKEYCL